MLYKQWSLVGILAVEHDVLQGVRPCVERNLTCSHKEIISNSVCFSFRKTRAGLNTYVYFTFVSVKKKKSEILL